MKEALKIKDKMKKQPIYIQELDWKLGKGYYWKEQAFEVSVARSATRTKCKNNSLVIC